MPPSTPRAIVAIGTALVVACNVALAQPQLTRPADHSSKQVEGVAAVVCDTPVAAAVGRDVLARGGSAVDAAVAVAFAMSVTWPEAGNIGGGGFMLVAPPDDDTVTCVDYRETAPSATDRNTFLEWQDRHHPLMAGVPGTVHGLVTAHKRFGRLPWNSLVAPAIDLARNGLVVDKSLAYSLNRTLNNERIRTLDQFAEFRRVYAHPTEYNWTAGQKLFLPDLANTLEQIAQDQGRSFYTGDLAEAIGRDVTASNGLISKADLENYSAVVRPALHTTVLGYEVYGAPPVSSGGTTVMIQLKILEKLGVTNDSDNSWTTKSVHLLAEAMRRAFRERAAHLGDPAFVSIPGNLLSDEHIASLASTVMADEATASEAIAGEITITGLPKESPDTTHFSIVDKYGMAVSNTYTLEGLFGSRFVVKGTGILLNNEMGDFDWVPGTTTTTGRIGTEANTVKGGKRMLSSQSPTIVKKDGRVFLVLGTPGGRTIINSVVGVLVQRLFFDRPLREAVDAPRIHHQWFPDVIRIERGGDAQIQSIAKELKAMGHTVSATKTYRQGSLHAIEVSPDGSHVIGVADGRRSPGAEAISGTDQ